MRFLKSRCGHFESAASIILFMLDLRIQQHFIDSADLQYQAAETLAKPLDAGVPPHCLHRKPTLCHHW